MLIATIAKNALEEVRVSIEQFKGRQLLSIRVWWHIDPLDEWKPSKKGLAMSVGKLPELIDALEKVREAITTEKAGQKGGTDDPDG